MSGQDGGPAPDWLVHLLADQADRDSRHAYDSQATIEATARSRANYIAKRLLGAAAPDVRVLMNAAYQEGIEKPGDVLRALDRVDLWLRALRDVGGWAPATPSEQQNEPTEAGK